MTTETQLVPTAAEKETASAMMQMITGYWVSQAIYVVAKLGIADLLKDGPKPLEMLAAETKANEDFLYRVLRALASIQVLDEISHRTFALTPFSQMLRTDHPNSLRAVSLMTGEEHYVAWGRLKDAVLTGDLPFESVYGMKVFEYFGQNPDAAATFNAAMKSISSNEHIAIVPAYPFAAFETVVDIGGGTGTLLGQILKANPGSKGILFDLPHVATEAMDNLQALNVANRCEIRHGNFFQAVPEGGDLYMMAHIIHDWSDEQSLAILNNIHRVMQPGGVLLLVECVIEPGNLSPRAKFMDLNMLVMTPGDRERTEAEFAELLGKAGFQLNRIIPTDSVVSIVEAIRQ